MKPLNLKQAIKNVMRVFPGAEIHVPDSFPKRTKRTRKTAQKV